MRGYRDNAWKSDAKGEEEAVLAEQHARVLARDISGLCRQEIFYVLVSQRLKIKSLK